VADFFQEELIDKIHPADSKPKGDNQKNWEDDIEKYHGGIPGCKIRILRTYYSRILPEFESDWGFPALRGEALKAGKSLSQSRISINYPILGL
jgi:hypothetical protein